MSLFKRILSSREAKAGTASLREGLETAWVGFQPPRWGGRDYRSLVQAGYLRNPVAHRAVRLISECAAAMPLAVRADGVTEPGHAFLELLRRPNPAQSGHELLEALYSDILLSGNAFLECVDNAGGLPGELYALRPERMTIVPGAKGWPRAYDYRTDGRNYRFSVDPLSGESPITHFRSFHPLDETYGFAPLNAAAAGIDLHNAAADWNKALLDNAARPSGALVFEPRDGRPETLSETQFARLKSELEEQYQGSRNAGRPFLLEGGLKWQQIALTPADMDFAEARNAAAREIALAFGVPPQLLGIPGDNTYANYQEANRAFWRMTILPLAQRVTETLNLRLGVRYGAGVSLTADLDHLPALAPERDALWARLAAADFLTADEKRAIVGLGPASR